MKSRGMCWVDPAFPIINIQTTKSVPKISSARFLYFVQSLFELSDSNACILFQTVRYAEFLFAAILAFRKGVAEHIANTVTCEDYGIAIYVFGNVNNGETAICLDIAFRAIRFHFDQFFFCVLLTVAGIDIFN